MSELLADKEIKVNAADALATAEQRMTSEVLASDSPKAIPHPAPIARSLTWACFPAPQVLEAYKHEQLRQLKSHEASLRQHAIKAGQLNSWDGWKLARSCVD